LKLTKTNTLRGIIHGILDFSFVQTLSLPQVIIKKNQRERMVMRSRLACCTWDRRGISIDFDQDHSSIMTYDGLESCIQNNQSYEHESGTSRVSAEHVSDSFDDCASSSCSSSKDVIGTGSFSYKWFGVKRHDDDDDQTSDDWELPHKFYVKDKPPYVLEVSDVETMKEKFAKLLLGEDITGGSKGITAALALSNAITSLAASVFGEMWKLEPLPEEKKNKWRREMDWLLSPTNYMVELVPAKQNGVNGRTLEIMTPKARADIHMNLPALTKLDSMLIETLDSMVKSEFSYSEVGSRAEGRNKSTGESKRWWLPLPQVPTAGLSDSERTKLINKSGVVYQVFKAARAINCSILLEMQVPTVIKDALHKSGREDLGEELYKLLIKVSSATTEEVLKSLNLQSEHNVLEVVNKLEAFILGWNERSKTAQIGKKCPNRTSEIDKVLVNRAEAIIQQLKARHPNLPHSFLDATKIQYGKDVGHAILEAYSRVMGNLAWSILTRIAEVLHEDDVNNPNPAGTTSCRSEIAGLSDIMWAKAKLREAEYDEGNKVEERLRYSDASNSVSDWEFCNSEPKSSSTANETPSRSRVWCIGGEACLSTSSPRYSP
ncbi:Rop guanine nucleotide exchange factor 14, partial [Linum grandiflorum]